MNEDWSKKEVELIVRDYFRMLHLELNQEKYRKSDYRAALLPLLASRSEGSIEFKHQNISAALINMGLPFIRGYKPRFNYQKQTLEKAISEYINANETFFVADFEKFSAGVDVITPESVNFEKMLDDDPLTTQLAEDEPIYKPIKINYLEKEQNNRQIGEAGEGLIMRYEKWRLINAGKDALADRVEWISKEQGDGLGFDILSKNTNGTDRYVEVKTTKLSKQTPIFFTKTELSFAKQKNKGFFLYRLYQFDTSPKFFIKNGEYESFCQIKPQIFQGYF
jgi:hypothetical protein